MYHTQYTHSLCLGKASPVDNTTSRLCQTIHRYGLGRKSLLQNMRCSLWQSSQLESSLGIHWRNNHQYNERSRKKDRKLTVVELASCS